MVIDFEQIQKIPNQLTTLSIQLSELKELLLKQPEKKVWLTRKEKANKENISVSMVDKLTRMGKFEKKKIGRKTLIKA